MEWIRTSVLSLIEELERQGWTWDGNAIQIEADKLIVALGAKTDKPIFVGVRRNEDTLNFDMMTKEPTDNDTVIVGHDEDLTIKEIADEIINLQETQGLDAEAVIELMIEEYKD
jgi:hypothetical protein